MTSKDDNLLLYGAAGAGILGLLAILFGPQILSQIGGNGGIKAGSAPTLTGPTYLANFAGKKKGCNCGA